MDNFAEFLGMGGYAKFVWPAYGLALIGLVGVLWQSVSSWKAREAEFGGLKAERDQDAQDGLSS